MQERGFDRERERERERVRISEKAAKEKREEPNSHDK